MSGLRLTEEHKRSADDWMHRHVLNPITSRLPTQTLLETTGSRSGLTRRTPVGGRLVGDQFWLVSNHGAHSDYVRNLQADPAVRVRFHGRWHSGVAQLMPEDDVGRRLATMPKVNAMFVRNLGTANTTIRVELDR